MSSRIVGYATFSRHSVPFVMFLEDRIKKLCEKIPTCESEAEVIEIARELRALIHQHCEELRGLLPVVPPLGCSELNCCASSYQVLEFPSKQ